MATQSQIKYNRLMEKSEEFFTSLGYKAVSMEDIATAAGISKMTIYKYFSSKEDLFIEVIFSIMKKTYAMLEEELAKIEGTIEKIDCLMRFNMETANKFSMAFYRDIMSTPYIIDKVMEEKYRVSGMFFKSIISEGVEKGEIRKVDVEVITEVLMMLLGGITERYSKKQFESREEIEELVESFYDFLKYGLFGGDGVKK